IGGCGSTIQNITIVVTDPATTDNSGAGTNPNNNDSTNITQEINTCIVEATLLNASQSDSNVVTYDLEGNLSIDISPGIRWLLQSGTGCQGGFQIISFTGIPDFLAVNIEDDNILFIRGILEGVPINILRPYPFTVVVSDDAGNGQISLTGTITIVDSGG
ncbi:MAG: hypothetical protein ACPH4N_04390, partial [Flavobacteriaceae bacterium]